MYLTGIHRKVDPLQNFPFAYRGVQIFDFQ
jgi:hypothetical protein